jgi:predicted nucleotidyltransferase
MTQEQLIQLAQQVAEASGALQIILFGSATSGHITADSDIDLLLVLPDDASPRKALVQAHEALLKRPAPLDLVPMRQSHWRQKASVLARNIARDGIVLYDR